MCRVASGVVLRTLATRGRKREGPTPQGVGGMERSGRSEGQYRLRLLPIKNMASKPTDSEAIFLHRQPTIRFL